MNIKSLCILHIIKKFNFRYFVMFDARKFVAVAVTARQRPTDENFQLKLDLWILLLFQLHQKVELNQWECAIG